MTGPLTPVCSQKQSAAALASALCLTLVFLTGGCAQKSPEKTGTADAGNGTAARKATQGHLKTQPLAKKEVNRKQAGPVSKTPGKTGEKKTAAASETSKKTVVKKTPGQQSATRKESTQPKTKKEVPPDPQQRALARINELGADVRFNSREDVTAINFKETEVTDDDLALLVHFPYLHELDLSHTSVTDAGMKHLAKVKRLSKLILYATDVTDKGIEELAPLNRLEYVCLDETKITDRSLETVGKWEDLEVLHLQSRDRSKITDAGLKHLLNLRFLKELKISGTAVTAQGVQKIQQAIPGCKIR